jgi:hypothetical protein
MHFGRNQNEFAPYVRAVDLKWINGLGKVYSSKDAGILRAVVGLDENIIGSGQDVNCNRIYKIQ